MEQRQINPDYYRPTLTEADAAKRANVSPFTMARERKRGRIACHRPGGHVIRYSEADVDAYIERSRTPSKYEVADAAKKAS